MYGPLFYLSHDVVVVTVRYRLGPLGFLSLGTESEPGNQGVRDQVLQCGVSQAVMSTLRRSPGWSGCGTTSRSSGATRPRHSALHCSSQL